MTEGKVEQDLIWSGREKTEERSEMGERGTTGKGREEMNEEKWGMGNGEWEMGNGKWEMGR